MKSNYKFTTTCIGCGVSILFVIATSVHTQDIDYPTLDPSWSYCYEFTWFGPRYNNVTTYDGTCEDYIDETRAGENIPCIAPIVISNNSKMPDMDYLWTYHRASILCMKAPNQACVKYTFIDNGVIANQSHMCARIDTHGGSPSFGCYKQKSGSYDVELCICDTLPGIRRPCNSATSFSLVDSLLLVVPVILIRQIINL